MELGVNQHFSHNHIYTDSGWVGLQSRPCMEDHMEADKCKNKYQYNYIIALKFVTDFFRV
jgi:hypothetical protein